MRFCLPRLPPSQCCPAAERGNVTSPTYRIDSEQIEIDGVPTAADCDGGGTSGLAPARGRTFTAPPAPKLIPKGRYGISLFVEIRL